MGVAQFDRTKKDQKYIEAWTLKALLVSWKEMDKKGTKTEWEKKACRHMGWNLTAKKEEMLNRLIGEYWT
jgi:hypothetical protein